MPARGFVLFLCLGFGWLMPVAAQAPDADFAVAADQHTIVPTQPLRKGERLQVQSPRLLENEAVVLYRCADAACTERRIIRAWHGRARIRSGPDLNEYVPLLEDGDYRVAASEIPTTLPQINFRGCLHSLPLQKLCSEARPLAITESRSEGGWLRARLSSGNWVWVRVARR